MIKSNEFNAVLLTNELIAWNAVKAVIENFLGKQRAANYPILVKNMLNAFSTINVNMSLKIHFMHHHLDYFGNQLASESDEHGERFHQTAMPMEIRYRGKKLNALLADICWWSHKINDGHDDDENDESDNDIVDMETMSDDDIAYGENMDEDDAVDADTEEYAYYSNDSSDDDEDDESPLPPPAKRLRTHSTF